MTQVDQLEVFMKMVRAMESGNHSKIKKADKLIRKALLDNKRRQVSSSVFHFTAEEKVIIDELA